MCLFKIPCYNVIVINMNNKGFTLIELLAVVAILGLVGVVVTISLSSSLSKLDKDKCNNFIEEIEDGACVLANIVVSRSNCIGPQCPEKLIDHECTRSNCTLKLDDLIKNGYIDRDYDPCYKESEKKALNGNADITVEWAPNGEMKCTYKGYRG